MKLALIGYGAMGQLVAARARDDGDQIAVTLDVADAARPDDELIELLRSADAAIEFSLADAVLRNATLCVRAGVPLVLGTTGWSAQSREVFAAVDEHNGALVYGSNFSIGVQMFNRIVARAADLFRDADGYEPFIEEAHHSRKRDAPSGTAVKLREIMTARLDREIPVASTRAGFIPGTHTVGFDSIADQVTLTHTARSREGFVAGALLAARWIIGRRGVFEFSETFDEIISQNRLR